MEQKYKYLEVIKFSNDEVVKRMDVTDEPERQIDRMENGLNINLNHNEYFTQQTESETELPTI